VREVNHCERLVALIALSQSPAVRMGGAHPSELRQQLQSHLTRAAQEFRALRARLTQTSRAGDGDLGIAVQGTVVPYPYMWAFVRVETEWLALYSSLQEYLGRNAQMPMNLDTLHTFGLTRQDSLSVALDSLADALSRWQEAQGAQLRRKLDWAVGFCFVVGALWLGWIAYFLVRPVRWMHRLLTLSEGEGDPQAILRRLRGTRWEPIASTLWQERCRLREVERFMRDLAMGRTPAPLTPIEPNDPLARSSFWLLRRMEEVCRELCRSRDDRL
jgi:hypothetical protein